MATLQFTRPSPNTPMAPEGVAAAVGGTVHVDVDGAVVTCTGPGITEANRAAIQAAINGYIYVDVIANKLTLKEQAALALATLQSIIDTAAIPAGTLTTAQLSNAARAAQVQIKDEARILRRLVRLAIDDYTGTD